jgi:hypothetical protein
LEKGIRGLVIGMGGVENGERREVRRGGKKEKGERGGS